MHLNFGARIKCQPIQILKHCTLKQRSVSKHTNFNQAAELVVHCTRVVGVKSLGKMRGMTRLMDLLFFDKGRIDKKNQIQCTRALRPVAAVRIAAAVRRAEFADRFHHAPSTIAKEYNYLQYDISQIRWSNDRG